MSRDARAKERRLTEFLSVFVDTNVEGVDDLIHLSCNHIAVGLVLVEDGLPLVARLAPLGKRLVLEIELAHNCISASTCKSRQ